MSQNEEVANVFQEMLSKTKPKVRYMAELYNEELTDLIYNQLFNGENEIATEKLHLNDIPEKIHYQEQMRRKFLSQAEREKDQLQHKLSYLENSIKSMKKYGQKSEGNKNLRGNFSMAESLQREKELRKELKKRQEIIDKRKKEAEQLKKKKEKELQQIEKKIKKEESEKKKKQILDHMKKIEDRMKDREKFVQSGNQRYKKLKNEKKVYEQLYKSFQEKENSLLQERKRKLAQIRNFHKPIDISQIENHEKKFIELKKQKEELRNRQLKMNEERAQSSRPSFYRSVFYRKAQEDERYQEENYSQVRAEKMKRFSEHVKEHFSPVLDDHKKQQLEKKLDEEKKKQDAIRLRSEDQVDKSRMKGKQYLTYLHKLQRPKRQKIPIDNSPKKFEYKNYLTHRQKKEDYDWKKIMKSEGNKKDKALLLHFNSQKVEQQLKRKEAQIKLNKKDLQGEVDNEYFQMIKAKLDLLELE